MIYNMKLAFGFLNWESILPIKRSLSAKGNQSTDLVHGEALHDNSTDSKSDW